MITQTIAISPIAPTHCHAVSLSTPASRMVLTRMPPSRAPSAGTIATFMLVEIDCRRAWMGLQTSRSLSLNARLPRLKP